MATEIINVARGWIGTPYRHQASLKGVGCDCLGLLRGVWRELGGAEPQGIPAYASDWNLRGAETLRDGLARHLTPQPLAAMAAGDIALFRMGCCGPAHHCGIVATRDGIFTLIHTRQNKRVSEEAFAPFWRSRLAYLFRI
jgi:NlpC/P60 family putative phage cell wall peptidase